MNPQTNSVVLEDGLDIRELCDSGSLLHISLESEENDNKCDVEIAGDYIGEPIQSFDLFAKKLVNVDKEGVVKKKILDEGGGMPLHEGCTVSIIYTGFWEDVSEPFDLRNLNKPLVVDLKDNGLLPGLLMAVKSMLVGETSVFLLSYKVMYGEMGIPPRIKPKADCVFYIKLVKSILTPKNGEINFLEPNMFQRVRKEVRLLYSSGVTLFKSKNINAAVKLFRKGVFMLHKCRLADEEEEKAQEKLLIKLYTNLAICYNHLELPLKACTACNELNRLNSLWNNSKVLFQNAKALRMIGQFDLAEKKIKRAMKLSPNTKEFQEELDLIQETQASFKKNKVSIKATGGSTLDLVSDDFKLEVDALIKSFKNNVNVCKLTLPEGLDTSEILYIKERCIRENLFCNMTERNFALDKNEQREVNVLDLD